MENTILSVRDLCAGYRNSRILDGISLDIQRGKIYSVIGPNGCGKTTLIRAMSRNLRPQSGQVLLDGKDIFRTNTKLVAQKMAVLCQNDTSMSDITVKTLVEYGRYAHKKWWSGTGSEELMLLDEPTTYLDIAHQLEIMELVAALNREEGITVVMVLHDMNHAARYSDELILLNRSKVHTIGAPRELLENGELENVFSVEAEILSDSEDNSPVFYAKRKKQ